MNVNLIPGTFSVDVITGIETPLEFLFSSFSFVEEAGLVIVLIVELSLVEIVCLGREVVVVVEGLLKMVNGVTFGLVNVGCDLIGVTG